jgi:hypothetical protein
VLIEAVVYGTEETPADVVLDDVQASGLQPWMLTVEPDTGELFVVLEAPEPFHPEEAGRPRRWVRVLLTGKDENGHGVLEAAATDRIDIVYGADPDLLQPMLPEDVYTTEEEALARNGMCHERAARPDDEEVAEGEEEPEPVFCGRQSSPDSVYRFCADDDQRRREESDDLVHRGYEPTYGVLAEAV